MLRSDTVKKAIANAEKYRLNAGGEFIVLTNASHNGAVTVEDNLTIFDLTVVEGADRFAELAMGHRH